MILKKIRTHSYVYLNEVVSDLRYLIKYMEFYPEVNDETVCGNLFFNAKSFCFVALL